MRNPGALAVEVEGRWVASRGSGLTAVGDRERGAAEALTEVGEEGWVCRGGWSVGHSRAVVGRAKRGF